MHHTTACSIAFLSYLVFVCLFLYVGKDADFLKSNIPEMIKAYREMAARGQLLGQFIFGVLLIVKVCVKASVWGFLLALVGVVLIICTGSSDPKFDVLRRLYEAWLRFYDLVRKHKLNWAPE